ncbi:sterol desaturase family protein [Nafulsella turpanensis]|uniref:sterol desaturase family protein n=1 Tax=Nafulsella turpanensis TaxID=1265690 RepID=UPI000349B606|nr:sterol desaturase family protein [Nafulsella turpanensis]
MKKSISSFTYRLYDFRGVPLVALAVGTLFVLEQRYALRRQRLPLLKRLKTNAQVVSIAMPVLRLALIPAQVKAAALTEEKKLGLLQRLPLPLPLAHAISFLALDWMNYLWHRLNHHWPLLWRFHQVHHTDLDMDVSTALRFHIGEILGSVPFKAGFILLMGTTPRATLIYEIFFELANNFHHSNLRLPLKTDDALGQIIVTPRMHGIHHSVVARETNNNYSVIFNLWDRLHHTLRLDVPQESINIGVPYVRHHQEVGEFLMMPFKEQVTMNK